MPRPPEIEKRVRFNMEIFESTRDDIRHIQQTLHVESMTATVARSIRIVRQLLSVASQRGIITAVDENGNKIIICL